MLTNCCLCFRICAEINACDPVFKKHVRELTCDDCKLNMDDVRRHLTNGEIIKGSLNYINEPLECTVLLG
jgi:hypothetical protein